MTATETRPLATRTPAVSSRVRVSACINGDDQEFLCEPRQSLLECLRDVVGLTGTKEGCNDGNCGACSVMLNGRLVNSCLVLGVEADGAEVSTVEGMATATGLHPLQQAFLEQAALQCGICTPGFLVAARALLESEPHPTEERVRFWLAGNLCRCTGYDKIIRAVMQAADLAPETVAAPTGIATSGTSNGSGKSNGKA